MERFMTIFVTINITPLKYMCSFPLRNSSPQLEKK